MFGRDYKAIILAVVAASVATTSDAFNLKCEFGYGSKKDTNFEFCVDVDVDARAGRLNSLDLVCLRKPWYLVGASMESRSMKNQASMLNPF